MNPLNVRNVIGGCVSPGNLVAPRRVAGLVAPRRVADQRRLRDQRGLSLAEMLVASAVFLLVILAAYQVFQQSNESYKKGQNQAEMVQNARVAFDQMVNDIRQGGYEFDVDGEITTYPNQADEPLEYMHFRALIVRANYDFDKELKGREQGLEKPETIAECCPVVTTGNDEIVGYALGKPQGTTQPSGTIAARFDISGTIDASDTDYRDAFIIKSGNTAGTITNEDAITAAGFELGALSDPPYTLYRFTFNEDGTVNKQPLVDNVHNLEFTYYNEADAVVVGRVDASTVTAGVQANWGDDNGQDKQAGRLTRWGVRRIRLLVQTMTPEADLHLTDALNEGGADQANFNGRRLFTLEEDIVPPNFGRRGQTDRDILPPEPVRNVEICTGECGFVRVSWVPGPPEDKIADHVVLLCLGACLDDLSNVKASFVVVANFDSTTDPDREYAVFTKEDSSWVQDGNTLWARVIARNVAGSESECPVADCPECCKSLAGATVASETRLDSFTSGEGSGYASTDPDWPDARNDNASRMLVVTDSLSVNYPHANAIELRLRAPAYTLNRLNGAGPPPQDWTTKNLATAGTASLACHREESTPDDASDDPAYRTKLENLGRDPEISNTYVFRVSGSDSWNWGRGSSGAVTDPRNFVPGPDNLYDFVYLPLGNDTVSYPDSTANVYAEIGGSTDQYEDRFDGTTTNVLAASGGTRPISQPPRAVTPGEVYYYKFRAVDVCWDDKRDLTANPQKIPNAVDDTSAAETAWATINDFGNNNAWRQSSMSISPFYPPLLDEGDVQGNRDRADQSVNDSDAYPDNNDPLDSYALPAYAIPATTTDGSAYVKPEKPTEFYMAKANDTVTDLIASGLSTKHDARLVFNSAKRSAPTEAGVEPTPVTYTTYRLYRKRATSMSPTGAEMAFAQNTATQLVEVRTGGQRALYNLTIDGAERGGPTAETSAANAASYTELEDIGTLEYPGDCAGAGENDGTQCFPWIYRLATAQCSNAALDDGIDTSSGEESDLSRPFLFPCQFYDQVEGVTLSPEVATGATSISVSVTMKDAGGLADPGCDGDPLDPTDTALKSARLLAYRGSGPYAGDWLGTSDWQATTAGSCDLTFDQAAIDRARREYGDSIQYVVELSDEANSASQPTDSNSTGCRVRSDLPGPGADFGVSLIGCAAECGGDGGNANVFRGTGGGAPTLATEVLAGDPNTIRVTIPKVAGCDTDAFTLYELEFAFVHVAGLAIPDFQSGLIADGLVGGSRALPSPSVTGAFGDGDVNESELFGADGTMRLRWYQSFCNSGGTCSYPKVRAGTDPLVVDITFAGPACDVKLTEFNFRVAVDFDSDAVADEMLCTRRGDTGAPADPQPPTGAGLINPGGGASGRGPTSFPAAACVTCADTCDVCECPINNNDADIDMDADPTISLLADPDDSGPGEKLVLEFTQENCTADCDFSLSTIVLDIGCAAGRTPPCDGNGINDLPKIEQFANRFKLVRSDITIDLPDPDFVDEADPSFHQYKWSNMAGIEILQGESFELEFLFQGDMVDTEIRALRLDFGGPLVGECSPSGPLPGASAPTSCNKVSPSPLPIN